MFRKLALSSLFISFSIFSFAQISQGGEPINWSDKHLSSDFPFIHTESINRVAIDAEDAVVDQYKEAPYRFGIEHEVSYTMENSGNWIVDPAGDLVVWQLGIHCPEATSVSLILDTFEIPKGGKLFVWNKERTHFLGSFTHENMQENGSFAIGLIQGDEIVLEYSVPLHLENWGNIEIGTIVHGYRNILASHFDDSSDRGPFGNSGACNINVNCPEGNDWQVEKRSVALIVQGGNAVCSGALVNNTAQDGTPYFLTANHCLGGSVANWVFYFNHESSNCAGSTGPTNNSISGSTLRASNAYSDFALLELSSIPPTNWNVQYSGWDRTDNEANVSATVGIHHPSGDVKKICFDDNAPYHSLEAGAQVWFVDQWELGVTEGGSSGSPLFNQDHRIIGQLYGGASACSGSVNNGQFDYYGRFGQSWDHGTTDATRLSNWLDPLGSNPTVLDGWPEGFVAAQLDAGSAGIVGVETFICGTVANPEFILRNFGVNTLTSCTIEFSFNGGAVQTINWNGSLAQYQEETVSLGTMTLNSGTNTINVEILNPNNSTDQNLLNNSSEFSLNANVGDTFDVTLSLEFDNFPEETSWELLQGGNVILTSGGTYSGQNGGDQVTEVLCLAAGCYTLNMIDDYGDGMCFFGFCGSYTLTDNLGQVLAEGADFEFSEATDFCFTGLGINEKSNISFSMYPNPADQFVRIQGFKNAELSLIDISGKTVFATKVKDAITIPLAEYAEGIYFIRLIENGLVSTQKLVIRK